ncbi:hypothetical protein Nepgr_021634 [Nepenthes gracilis]|uniref:Uncharacterized protein n=1 Tax=Nepenthes gracilis TaxID=150966 RepID=A0AAD3SYK7_NEPGR|nr:hypothetical protein Nepgr_021634 [Nepenthes gracilis]
MGQGNPELSKGFLFRPDVVGPSSLTHPHIAASGKVSENVLVVFFEDLGKVGAHPLIYSFDFILYVNIDMGNCILLTDGSPVSFQTQNLVSQFVPGNCKQCKHRLDCGYESTALTYRSATPFSAAIAAVFACAALLFQSSPKVYVFKPFSWEFL